MKTAKNFEIFANVLSQPDCWLTKRVSKETEKTRLVKISQMSKHHRMKKRLKYCWKLSFRLIDIFSSHKSQNSTRNKQITKFQAVHHEETKLSKFEKSSKTTSGCGEFKMSAGNPKAPILWAVSGLLKVLPQLFQWQLLNSSAIQKKGKHTNFSEFGRANVVQTAINDRIALK